MQTWVKHPELTFGAPDRLSSPGTGGTRSSSGMRSTDQWRMLLAARHSDGPERRRGVIAQCVSTDLMTWQHTEPFWDPRRYITHECPDVFAWGDWWYMVYSEFSESFTTRYRMAKSPDGPVDGAGPGQHRRPRLLRLKDRRAGRPPLLLRLDRQQGRQYRRRTPGSGPARCPSWKPAKTRTEHSPSPSPMNWWTASGRTSRYHLASGLPTRLDVPDGYTAVISEEELPSQFYAKAVLDIAPDTTECGLLLRSSAGRGPVLHSAPGTETRPAGLRQVAAGHHRRRPMARLRRRSVRHRTGAPVRPRPRASTPWRSSSTATSASPSWTGRWPSAPGSTTCPRDGSALFAGEGSVTVTDLEIRKRTDN